MTTLVEDARGEGDVHAEARLRASGEQVGTGVERHSDAGATGWKGVHPMGPRGENASNRWAPGSKMPPTDGTLGRKCLQPMGPWFEMPPTDGSLGRKCLQPMGPWVENASNRWDPRS